MTSHPHELWLAVLCACAIMSACRTPEKGGPRRTYNDAGVEDAGARAPTSCAAVSCTAPAVCDENNGKPACACPPGYTGNPSHCEDVDECQNAMTNACSPNANCSNVPGSYDCKCNAGFAGNGKDCLQLNDCGGAANSCHSDAQCTKVDEGVQCTCVSGFSGDGQICQDVDECAQQGEFAVSCGTHASCQNRRGSYACSCDVLFEGDAKTACRDSCEVALTDAARCDVVHGHARCTYGSDGTAGCTSCLPGYTGDGKTCTTSSECAALNCGDNTVCNGTAGQRACACARGFSGDPKTGCADIDECESGQTDCDAASTRCLNVPGSYVCACKDGFERVNGVCVNIDECARDLDLCDSSATCTDRTPDADSPRGYTCQCKPGYQGDEDGFVCVDIDECKNDDACVKDDNVSCQNTRGGYECLCPKNFIGDAKHEGCYCDLSGYWATREDATLELHAREAGGVKIIAASTNSATVWELNRFTYDGQNLVIETQACGADLPAEIYSPLYEEVYATYIPTMVYDQLHLEPVSEMMLPKSAALPGKPFNTPHSANVTGLKMNDPLNDPWPDSTDKIPADAWTDPDNDGEPGMSLWPGQTTKPTLHGAANETYSYLPVALVEGKSTIATRVGCVSTAIRAITHREGSIETCGRMSGKLITERYEGRVHSCMVLRTDNWDTVDINCTAKDWSAARKCSPDQVQFLDEQDQTTKVTATFELVKLAGLDAKNIDCATVRDSLPAIPRQ